MLTGSGGDSFVARSTTSASWQRFLRHCILRWAVRPTLRERRSGFGWPEPERTKATRIQCEGHERIVIRSSLTSLTSLTPAPRLGPGPADVSDRGAAPLQATLFTMEAMTAS